MIHRWIALLLALLIPGQLFAQDKALRCVSADGALLVKDGVKWRALQPRDEIPLQNPLVAMFTAELQSADAVGIKLIADVAERGVFPVLESAIIAQSAKGCDVDIALDRGIIVLSNRKKEGAVKIRVRVLAEEFDVTLPDAKTRVAIERYGRHVAGMPELTDAKKDRPVTSVFFFTLEGEAVIEHATKATRLNAPPGTALMHWDDATDTIETKFYDRLPEMVKPLTPEEKQRFDTVNAHARKLVANADAIGKAIDNAPADLLGRKTAVLAMGALDDLPRLVAALGNAKDAEARDFAVLVLRHWLGREAGQSIKLNRHLTQLGYSPVQAKTLGYLINGIEESRRLQPGTYEVLISSLNHSKLPVRELARWHLTRLVPDAKAITYDAAAPEAMRLRAIEQWRKLIPAGELPQAPKK